jgi:CIC family chloride channel protein
MGALYGGIAHVPLSALILVCELAGNYDLLVPLMLALGISFVATRRTSLYEAQATSPIDSPAHRDAFLFNALRGVKVRDAIGATNQFKTFHPTSNAAEMLVAVTEANLQDVFPVVDREGKLLGIVTASSLRLVAVESQETRWLIASDLMQPAVSVTLATELRTASERFVANGLHELPVVDDDGRVFALLDELDVAQWYLGAKTRTTMTPLPGTSLAP